MRAILVMELRGFQALASELVRECEKIGLTADRVRASGISLMNGILDQAAEQIRPDVRFHVGGDTWYFNFDNFLSALQYASLVCAIALEHATSYGTFFLKPAMAINLGEPKLDGQRFLDDQSIMAYRFADKGKSYSIRVIEGALEQAKREKIKLLTFDVATDLGPFGDFDWQSDRMNAEVTLAVRQVPLPQLLMDSDVHFSDGTSEAVDLLLRQQYSAKSILSFGGPAPLSQPIYRDYIRQTISMLRQNSEKKFTVLSYIPLDEPAPSFAWLELCKRLAYMFPGQYAFGAFSIPEGQLRPFAYHVYDTRDVYVGLRSFSPQRGTATLSAGIVFRTQQVALRFRDELHENYRKIGPIDDSKFADITAKMSGLTNEIRRAVLSDVDAILAL